MTATFEIADRGKTPAVEIVPPETDQDLEIIKIIGCRPWAPFCPSIDLNAAFAAAEKVGLFQHVLPHGGESLCLAQFPNGQWVLQGDTSGCLVDFTDLEATPALAIHAAILKLEAIECPTP
jgi:hypothetical protein